MTIETTELRTMHCTRLTLVIADVTLFPPVILNFYNCPCCGVVDTVLVKRKLAYNWDHTFSRISGRQR